ncbi:hypothetical protein EG328_000071 [Venturia inaequalis]|uniref:chitinase n=1 Tax=Venturia inaequalis TaxID=5025 RepID=A0A8H3Z869_VENIN|nr:hypothetical protein EG328_000071 [Venturia inaequalis]
MFGPARPHWLEQASNAFRRRPKDHAQSKWSSPPMRMYANAIYYPNYRASIECPPSSLRCDIISHIFYAFAAISESGEVYLDNHETDCNISIDGTQGCLRALAQLKSRYGHLKLILSVGGAKGNKTAFSNASSDESRRSRFATSARCLVDRYYFDGIDVDWEHPENWEGENYVQLMTCLRYHLPAPRYIVSTALPAGEWVLSRYNLPQLASSIDFLNLMAYDFTGDWGDPKISGHHAQLYANHGGGSTHPAIDYILGKGFPPNKILLGCPCYGWSFLNCNNINQPCENCGGAGGAFDYKDLPRPGTQECVDEGPVAAFCVGGDGGFVTYDNVDTVAAKAGYAKRRGLGGIFFWHGLADKEGDRSLVYTSYKTLHE